MTRRDESALFAVKGVTGQKPRLAPVAVLGKVWGLQAIPQKEGVAPLLSPQLRPIDCRWKYCDPVPGLCPSSHMTWLQYRGPLQCGRQRVLCSNLPPSPHGRPTLPEAGRVVCRLEFHLAPECRD